jgi:hypothetical protein
LRVFPVALALGPHAVQLALALGDLAFVLAHDPPCVALADLGLVEGLAGGFEGGEGGVVLGDGGLVRLASLRELGLGLGETGLAGGVLARCGTLGGGSGAPCTGGGLLGGGLAAAGRGLRRARGLRCAALAPARRWLAGGCAGRGRGSAGRRRAERAEADGFALLDEAAALQLRAGLLVDRRRVQRRPDAVAQRRAALAGLACDRFRRVRQRRGQLALLADRLAQLARVAAGQQRLLRGAQTLGRGERRSPCAGAGSPG